MSLHPDQLSSDQSPALSPCDLEPIHTPSLIQPHGVLVVARSSDMRIVFCSENSNDVLGLTATGVFQTTLPALLGTETVARFEAALRADESASTHAVVRSLALPLQAPLEASVHRRGDLFCIELERSTALQGDSLTVFQFEQAMFAFGQYQELHTLCSSIPCLVRSLTGYDRVMVYQFLADGCGQVVGEDRDPSMEPFLGLHYPASDIPRQARRLYLQKRLTMIPDIGYAPVPMLRNPRLPQGEPLDMTACNLRSVSPIHIEYQKNMGVAASLGLSIVHKNELWGLVICHHRSPKLLRPATRAMCNLMGQIISGAIGESQRGKEDRDRLQTASLLATVTQAMEAGGLIADSLAGQEQALLTLVGSDGVVVRHGGQTRLLGKTPPLEEATALMAALASERPGGGLVNATEEIGVLLPSFAHLAPDTCGAVLTSLRQSGDGILWLRGETVRTIRWAGQSDSAKGVAEGTLKISPRKSFAVWEQVVYGRSLAWKQAELDAALALQTVVVHQEFRLLAAKHS